MRLPAPLDHLGHLSRGCACPVSAGGHRHQSGELERKPGCEARFSEKLSEPTDVITSHPAQYCQLWPWNGVSGHGQNARTTGGAGILPAAILREARLGRLMLTVLGISPVPLALVRLPPAVASSAAGESLETRHPAPRPFRSGWSSFPRAVSAASPGNSRVPQGAADGRVRRLMPLRFHGFG